MKKTLLRLMPLMAAVMLTTACSKDDDTSVETQNTPSLQSADTTANNPEGVPFRIKVVTGKLLSKIAYADDGQKVTPTFTQDDVDNQLAMTIKGDNYNATLYLKDLDGNFEANVASLPPNNTTLTAEILYNAQSTVTTHDNSLQELMESCSHKYTAEFKYPVSKIKLTDYYAYLEIFMSKTMVYTTLEGNNKTDRFVFRHPENSNVSKVFVKVEPNKSYTIGSFLTLSADQVQSGNIYTIDRSGYVDLGISDGTLWADKNIGATENYENGTSYTFNGAQAEAITLGVELPTSYWDENEAHPTTDFERLKNECHWEFYRLIVGSGSYYGVMVYKARKPADCGFTDTEYNIDQDNHIFFPFTTGNTVSSEGEYWSGSRYRIQPADFVYYYMNCSVTFNNSSVYTYAYDEVYSDDDANPQTTRECFVRAVYHNPNN